MELEDRRKSLCAQLSWAALCSVLHSLLVFHLDTEACMYDTPGHHGSHGHLRRCPEPSETKASLGQDLLIFPALLPSASIIDISDSPVRPPSSSTSNIFPVKAEPLESDTLEEALGTMIENMDPEPAMEEAEEADNFDADEEVANKMHEDDC